MSVRELASIIFKLSAKTWTRVWFLPCPRSSSALLLAQAHASFTIELNSNCCVFFLTTSFVKFYSIPPVPVFQDSLSMLAALLKSGFGWLTFLSLGWFAGLLFQFLCCYTVGTEKCQNKCRKMCQLLVHAEESWSDNNIWQKQKHC